MHAIKSYLIDADSPRDSVDTPKFKILQILGLNVSAELSRVHLQWPETIFRCANLWGTRPDRTFQGRESPTAGTHRARHAWCGGHDRRCPSGSIRVPRSRAPSGNRDEPTPPPGRWHSLRSRRSTRSIYHAAQRPHHTICKSDASVGLVSSTHPRPTHYQRDPVQPTTRWTFGPNIQPNTYPTEVNEPRYIEQQLACYTNTAPNCNTWICLSVLDAKLFNATCIVAFTSLFIVGNNKCTALLSSSHCSVFKHALLAEQMDEWMNIHNLHFVAQSVLFRPATQPNLTRDPTQPARQPNAQTTLLQMHSHCFRFPLYICTPYSRVGQRPWGL